MVRYVAIVDGADPVWGARLPDFPGCHGGGATAAAAIDDIVSALSEVAADMIADGEALPAPTDLGSVIEGQRQGREGPGATVYLAADH